MQDKTKEAHLKLAMSILYAVGGRQSDVVHLRMSDIQDSMKRGFFTRTIAKTDHMCGPHAIPVSAELINLYKNNIE
jgi:integrase